MKNSILLTIALCLLNFSSFANELNKLCDVGELPDFKYNSCLYSEHKKSDQKLNAVYKELMATLGVLGTENVASFKGTQWASRKPDVQQKSLKKAQRSWIKYRDNNCNYYMELHYPGSASLTEQIKCKLLMTIERVNELEKQQKFWSQKYPN